MIQYNQNQMPVATRWTALSKDPNSAQALAHRTVSVQSATAANLISNRLAYLCDLASGKDVLDVGVVEHLAEASYSDSWLHGHLHRHAKRCIGVDILEPDVADLRKRGFNIICADLTVAPLEESFDLIVCGEVFEHLPSPQFMLANLAKMLRGGGRIIVTVPNPWYLNVVLKSVIGRHAYIDNADHVCWFDPATMSELAERVGLKLARYAGVAVSNPKSLRARMLFSLQPVLIALGMNPHAFGKSMIYELVAA